MRISAFRYLCAGLQLETPFGNYNPDWAVLFEMDGEEQLFFVVENKGSMDFEFLRHAEQGKIECGKAHFKELAKAREMLSLYM